MGRDEFVLSENSLGTVLQYKTRLESMIGVPLTRVDVAPNVMTDIAAGLRELAGAKDVSSSLIGDGYALGMAWHEDASLPLNTVRFGS